ncbi:MAG: L-2-hydroxyglutarate oxidase [Pseudomonadota bacterium]|nr:L-2-hydroxyglutarate oxidase [Pseudomonadota bacterium]
MTDFLVIGGGIIGISIARELKRTYADASVEVVEKESSGGEHASGRNSGVLHAGFYYTADSLKARFTRDGNRELTEYCESRKIPLNKCGKLVVAKNETEDVMLDELMVRGRKNGVLLDEVTAEEAKEIEPRVKTYRRALFSPTTSSADPRQVLAAMEADAKREGIRISYSVSFVSRTRDGIRVSDGVRNVGYVVNAAGLYADRIGKEFGFSENYTILPFKGLYLSSDEPPGAFRTNIYPVPDLRNPFLGVHFTVKADGRVKIGPTAIPALWREQYSGFENFNSGEAFEMALRSASLLFSSGFGYSGLALSEVRKYSRRYMVKLAGELATGIEVSAFRKWARPGIRAQLLDTRTRRLEMDFVLEGDSRSMHVLNAVSPGWTCSLPFSAHVVKAIDKKLG